MCDVIIPAYRPGPEFRCLLRRLHEQTRLPHRILVINTEEQYWDASFEKEAPLLSVMHIRKEDFDHGGTRRMAASLSEAPVLVFMTQDCLPADRKMLEKLTEALYQEESIGAAYARQLPRKEASCIERLTRAFNYPSEPHIYYEKDIQAHGIKTFFCSNVCAAYRRDAYVSCGGFVESTIFGEDMLLAEKMVRNGYGIAYAADARVIHSHDYGCMEQLRRNFDMGVSHAQHPEVYADLPSEGEGLRMVRQVAAGLARKGQFAGLPRLMVLSAAKYAGYRLGKAYRRLPRALAYRLTLSPGYLKNTKR